MKNYYLCMDSHTKASQSGCVTLSIPSPINGCGGDVDVRTKMKAKRGVAAMGALFLT